MTERDALLRAICANPDDDTPRLVYADWLDEHGDRRDRARAGLIRASISIHRGIVPTCNRITGDNVTREGLVSPVKRCRCDWCKLSRRSWMASRSYAGEWRGEALKPIEDERVRQAGQVIRDGGDLRALFATHTPIDVLFRRGFVECLSLTVSDFMGHAGSLCTLSPIAEIRLISNAPMECSPGHAWDRRYPEGRFQFRDFGPWTPGLEFDGNDVPSEIYELMPDAVVLEDDEHLKLYPSRERADESLRHACLMWGRQERDRLWARSAAAAA
ncbi:TIGR02996 domain-containing protein [Frigoriglobus tundricola]|uniref:TIGR02996 domain-containing protein n=1 Tax=Frigoriglobus tundricola TaxID=2774151 RepID=A0A6M5YJK5_9BACT|nr:TIGR02996 domain-containing protein [Frigoriglobus tundricola]QJW93152.1 hypothetical protein FTUN_0657 [Frigoriglobus tundricola]